MGGSFGIKTNIEAGHTIFKINIFCKNCINRYLGTIIRKYVFLRYTMWVENKLVLKACTVS